MGGQMNGGDRVAFRDLDLVHEAPGIDSRSKSVNGVRWAYVSYGPGALREEWCTEGHTGYVVEGSISFEIENDQAPLDLAAGDGFNLADGKGHRGRAGSDGATLFVIDRAV